MVGAVTERIPVYLAVMQDSSLLGLDYLSRVEACLNLYSGRMSVRGHKVPLNPGGHAPVGKEEKSKCHKSYAAAYQQPTRNESVTEGSWQA